MITIILPKWVVWFISLQTVYFLIASYPKARIGMLLIYYQIKGFF